MKKKYFTQTKDFLVALIGIIGLVYSLNFSFGTLEFLPDALPIIGHIDEAAALFLVYSALEYFGVNIKSIFTHNNKK